MTLQSDKRAHTASASLWSTSPLISLGSVEYRRGHDRRVIARDGDEIADRGHGGGFAAGAGPGNRHVPGIHAGDDGRVLRSDRPREERCARHEHRRHPGRQRRPLAVVVGVRNLPNGPAPRAGIAEVFRLDPRGRPRLDPRGADAKPEPERAQNRELRRRVHAARDRPTDPTRRSRARTHRRSPRRSRSRALPSATARRCSCRSGLRRCASRVRRRVRRRARARSASPRRRPPRIAAAGPAAPRATAAPGHGAR